MITFVLYLLLGGILFHGNIHSDRDLIYWIIMANVIAIQLSASKK